MLETELKYAVHPSFVTPELAGSRGLAQRELGPQELRATYYDTEDLRLARHGITLRFRSGDDEGPGWTLKLPANGAGAALARHELRFEGHQEGPPHEAQDLVTAYARLAPLDAVATLVTARRRWVLEKDGPIPVALVSDDEVTLLDGDRVLARFREVEIESAGKDASILEVLAEAMAEAGAHHSEPIPKVVRALGPRATAPPDVPEPIRADPEGPAETVLLNLLRQGTDRLLANDAGVRLGDPHSVHQMRVAARRLRSDLGTFAPLTDPAWSERLIQELRAVGSTLGLTRDLDVLRSRIEALGADLLPELAPLLEGLDDQATKARADMLAFMRGERYKELLEHVVDAARQPRLTAVAGRPAGTLLPGLVRPRYKKLEKAVRGAGRAPKPEALHRIRIHAKRLRYATEAVVDGLEKRDTRKAADLARHATKVQEVLGKHQDSIVTGDTVRSIARERSGDAGFVIAAGRLIEREAVQAQRSIEEWRGTWEKLSKSKSTSWLDP